MQVENRYLILHRLVNDISIYSFIWYNERKIEGVVPAYIYLCWDFKAIGKNSIEDNEKPTAQQIPLQQLYTLWINKLGLCKKKNKLRNCFNGQFSGHANVLCISYMAQEANIWLTQTMSRYSHYWPGHLQYSHCYTEVVMWATGAQKGVRDREKRKRERQATVLAFIVPFSRPPIQYNNI